jgi:RNA polymerase sigma-70 factor (ECF subfamily)
LKERAGRSRIQGEDNGLGCDLEAIWDEEWERHLFNAAVENIKKHVNPEQYQLFDLYVLQKWPLKKITATLGVNAGQVYLAKHRVGRTLRKEVRLLEARLR